MVRKLCFCLLVTVVPALFLGTTTPVLAVQGRPQLEATVVGSNEFAPGQTGPIQIMLQNRGVFSGAVADPDDKVMALGYSSPTGVILVPPCTTAVGVTATLQSPTSSIQVVNGPVGIGTLPRGQSMPQPITFELRVGKEAQAKTYCLELELEYQYLDHVDWLNAPQKESPYYEPEFKFHWSQAEETQDISVEIVGTYFSVTNVETKSIRAGATGTISTTVENNGAREASDITAEIAPGGIFVPVDNQVFLGDLAGGESRIAEFKVTVSPEAIAEASPLDIVIKYKDENDVPRQTLITVGIPIGAAENDFLVTEVKTEGVCAGSIGTITLTLEKNVAGEAHEVTAEIVPGEYFVPVDKASFLGDMKNGEPVITQFRVSVSEDAIVKTSPLDIMIKYKDADNVARQALVTVGIQVKAEPEFEVEPILANRNLTPGAKTIIEIPIKNVSEYTVKDAVARINVVNPFSTAPFSTTDDTAYIGMLQPGESGTAKFKITVDADAVPKAYALEVEVKYIDSLGNSYTSKSMMTTVTVQPSPRLSRRTIIIISLVAAAILIVLFRTRARRRKPVTRG
jgi:hypothetical protein